VFAAAAAIVQCETGTSATQPGTKEEVAAAHARQCSQPGERFRPCRKSRPQTHHKAAHLLQKVAHQGSTPASILTSRGATSVASVRHKCDSKNAHEIGAPAVRLEAPEGAPPGQHCKDHQDAWREQPEPAHQDAHYRAGARIRRDDGACGASEKVCNQSSRWDRRTCRQQGFRAVCLVLHIASDSACLFLHGSGLDSCIRVQTGARSR